MSEVQDGTCSVSARSLHEWRWWVGLRRVTELDKCRIPLCTAPPIAQSHITCFWESTATPPECWAMGLVCGTQPPRWSLYFLYTLLRYPVHTICPDGLVTLWRHLHKSTESLLEVRQDASVTHSSSFIQGSVLLLTTWIRFMAKNGQDSRCTDSLTFHCLSEGTRSV